MSLLRADRIANRYNTHGPIIVGPATVTSDLYVTDQLIVSGIAVTNGVTVGTTLTTTDLRVDTLATLNKVVINGITTAGIITGATYYGDGVNLTGIVTQVTAGAGIQILGSQVGGKGTVRITANNVGLATYAVQAGTSTHINGGSAGQLVFQANTGITSFTATGTAGEILQSNGTAAPSWTSLAAINVSYADTAGIATNLKGGSSGRIPYQSGIDQTTFTTTGTTGQILKSQGSTGPTWLTPGTDLVSAFAKVAGVSTSVVGGAASVNGLYVTGISTLQQDVNFLQDIGVVGVVTTKDIVATGIATLNQLEVGTAGAGNVGITSIVDEDDMISDSASALPTQQSVKAYVDAQVTAQDLDGSADVGTFTVDLDSQVLDVSGTANEIYTIGSGQTVTVGLDTNVTIPNNLVVVGMSSVTGLATFTGDVLISGFTTTGTLMVGGASTLSSLKVTGFTSTQDLDVIGIATINQGRLTNLDVSGVGTITTLHAGVTSTASLDVSGISTFNQGISSNFSVTGVGTIQTLHAGVTSTASLDVSGIGTISQGRLTNLDVSGVGTITTLHAGITSSASLNVSGIGTFDTVNSRALNVVGGISSIATLAAGVATARTLDVIGVTTLGSVEVTGLTTTNQVLIGGITTVTNTTDNTLGDVNTGSVQLDGGAGIAGNLTVGAGLTATNLNVSSASTFIGGPVFIGTDVSTNNDDQLLQITGDSYFKGNVGVGTTNIVGAADTQNTTVLNVGIITAAKLYGDGSALTGVIGFPAVTNLLYVTEDGDDDDNDGRTLATAKRTVGAALTLAAEGSIIRVSAGNYSENNPLIMPEQVSIMGDSLREVSLSPQNANEDFIYVANGNFVGDISFTGTLNEGRAVIAFNPNKPSYVTQGPYIRNATNFISNSIGMKIDGRHVMGDTKSMNVDSYTQYNQGGIGVSISNDGYAQLVSIFTICNDQSIVCINGGQCDLTNSNSSFGRLGLVADGIGSRQFLGTVTQEQSANSNIFPIDIGVDTLSITDADYDNTTGLTTITTSTNHGFNVGMSVTMKDMTFTCDSQLPVTSFGISTANYDRVTGIMTVQTSVDNNFYVGASVTFAQLVFSCDSGGGVSTAYFPPAPGDNNGAANHVFDVITVGTSTEFTVNVGPSTIAHSYEEGGNVSISTYAPFPSGAFGNIFTVDSVVSPTSFTAYVGVSTLAHTYESGGEVETFITRPYDGQVVYLDELYNSISGVTITNGGSGYTSPPVVTFSAPTETWGITATGVARLTDGVVTSIDMISNGRGYTGNPTVNIDGTASGTPDILPTYYVVSSATPVVGGITTVTFTENVPYVVGVGTTVPFFKQSRVLASSHAFEYIGSGNTITNALPARGGISIQDNEINNLNGGLVIYTSTDQAGNFRIGDGVVINQVEGSIGGDAYQRSLFANITPYILALGGGD